MGKGMKNKGRQGNSGDQFGKNWCCSPLMSFRCFKKTAIRIIATRTMTELTVLINIISAISWLVNKKRLGSSLSQEKYPVGKTFMISLIIWRHSKVDCIISAWSKQHPFGPFKRVLNYFSKWYVFYRIVLCNVSFNNSKDKSFEICNVGKWSLKVSHEMRSRRVRH